MQSARAEKVVELEESTHYVRPVKEDRLSPTQIQMLIDARQAMAEGASIVKPTLQTIPEDHFHVASQTDRSQNSSRVY